MRILWACGLGAVTLALACSNNFAPQSYVSDLRLLTVVAEPPEVWPPDGGVGDDTRPARTTLTAVWADPSLPDATPTFGWSYCAGVPSAQDGEIALTCLPDGGAPLTMITAAAPSGNTDVATWDPVPFTTVFSPGPPLAFPIGLPDNTDGFYLPVRLDMTEGDQSVVSFYRLRYHFSVPGFDTGLNHNPMLTGLFQAASKTADDSANVALVAAPTTAVATAMPATPIPVSADSVIDLRAFASDDSFEQYYSNNGDLTATPKLLTETISIVWYTTGGTFDHDATGNDRPNAELTFKKRAPASGQTIDVWVIAKDERGGNSILYVPRLLQFN